MADYNKYAPGHWSTESDTNLSLKKYIDMYQDVYNKTNLDKILDKVEDNKKLRICDYGGGVGIVAIELAKKGHTVTLVDGSSDALDAANLYAQKENVEITTLCAISLDENKYTGYFDIVISKDLIEHIDDDSSMLKNFYSSLKKDGELILTTQNSNSFNYLLEGGIRKIIHPTVKWMGWDRTHVRFYTSKTLELLAKENRFHSVQFHSSYIFPYKLASKLFFWTNPRESNFLYAIDKFFMKKKAFSKLGWNIMMICKK
jgi:2-polyprenyl-6-hydroxyphenyl methylase / 3-demethylubiquinone-9 3-methyltransferase